MPNAHVGTVLTTPETTKAIRPPLRTEGVQVSESQLSKDYTSVAVSTYPMIIKQSSMVLSLGLSTNSPFCNMESGMGLRCCKNCIIISRYQVGLHGRKMFGGHRGYTGKEIERIEASWFATLHKLFGVAVREEVVN